MKLGNSFFFATLLALLMACSNNSPSTSCSGGDVKLASPPTGSNVMAITVDGSLCDAGQVGSYANKPCAQVTICVPGSTTQCQTISNLLLDTGSVGLRLFKSVVTIPLTNETAPGGGTLTDCVYFGDSSSEWGAVAQADVTLGALKAGNVPIQIIDSTFGTTQGKCTAENSKQDTSPSEAGFNGILGVGIRQYDCGLSCGANPAYYSCTGSTCTTVTAPVGSQVQNPVALMPAPYNTGIVLELPDLNTTGGVCSASGVLVMGADQGTSPSSRTVYSTTANGFMQTKFDSYGSSYIQSFLDSGTNYYVIPPPTSGASDCSGAHGGSYSGLLCNSSVTTYSASNESNGSGATPVPLTFQVGDAYSLLNSGNHVFNDIGANNTQVQFDWGLPFFFGKVVSIGISTKQATGLPGSPTGPYYAY